MFERYTEKARRVMFFARYEASQFGCLCIEPEHLLLGILREDKDVTDRFLPSQAGLESIRKQIEEHTTLREKVSTSVDLPMSSESKRVLEYAAEESHDQRPIGPAHLLLGILRLENCFAAAILHRYGLSLVTVRQEMQDAAPLSSVKKERSKPTACRDCKHLMVVNGPIQEMNLFCGASPLEPEFDCYSGEFKSGSSTEPADRFKLCAMVNFGDCDLFEVKEG